MHWYCTCPHCRRIPRDLRWYRQGITIFDCGCGGSCNIVAIVITMDEIRDALGIRWTKQILFFFSLQRMYYSPSLYTRC